MRYKGMANDEIFELIKQGQRLNELIPIALKIIEEKGIIDFENPTDDEFSILDKYEDFFKKNKSCHETFTKLKIWNKNRDNCVNRTNKKRIAYHTEVAAEDAAIRRSISYKEQVPYLCDQCGDWHLSPKSRHTPSKLCDYCTDGNGESKELYSSEEDAKNRSKIIKQEENIILNIYKCPRQKGWHLTKR